MGGGDRQNLMSLDLGRSGPDLGPTLNLTWLGPGPGPELDNRRFCELNIDMLYVYFQMYLMFMDS